MENSRTCKICKVNVHRASFVKQLLRSKKHLENIRQSFYKLKTYIVLKPYNN